MKKLIFTLLVLLIISSSFAYNIEEIKAQFESNPELLDYTNETVQSNYDWQNKTYSQFMDDSKDQSDEIFGGQNFLDPKLAFGMSMVIPGSGEMYSKSYVKGAVFMALEAGLWVGYFTLMSTGNTKRDEYEEYQRNHFDANTYLEWYEVVTDGFSVEKGTEILPYKNDDRYDVDMNHDFYEMTGKYPWFYLGWDDCPDELNDPSLYPDLWNSEGSTSELTNILLPYHTNSTTVKKYMTMRRDANDYFIWSKWVLGAAIFNHLASAFDAAWTAHNHNQKLNKGFSERVIMEPAFTVHNPTGKMVPGVKLVVNLK